MDKIIIKNLLVRGIIGINDWEREKAQDILINIEISADLSEAGKSDKIEDTVNYRTISKKVIANVETAARFTVEALAYDVADLCLEDKQAKHVMVRIEKPGAIRFAESVGVEVERNKHA
jgi:FolB domain-containing protein